MIVCVYEKERKKERKKEREEGDGREREREKERVIYVYVDGWVKERDGKTVCGPNSSSVLSPKSS